MKFSNVEKSQKFNPALIAWFTRPTSGGLFQQPLQRSSRGSAYLVFIVLWNFLIADRWWTDCPKIDSTGSGVLCNQFLAIRSLTDTLKTEKLSDGLTDALMTCYGFGSMDLGWQTLFVTLCLIAKFQYHIFTSCQNWFYGVWCPL